jgi:hypothetical protein
MPTASLRVGLPANATPAEATRALQHALDQVEDYLREEWPRAKDGFEVRTRDG